MTRHDAFRRGMREMLPFGPGVFAWGLVTGVAMVKSGLSIVESLGLSLLAYAGSAQLAALPLMAVFAPLWLVTLAAIIVNLRFVVYAALLRSHLGHLPANTRLWLGYFTGDVMFARFSALLAEEPDYPHRVAYFAGGATANWIIWQVSSVIGIFAAGVIPTSWGLELAGTFALLALLIPLCRQWPALGGVAVAVIVAVIAHELPLRLGLLAATLAGMTAAIALERRLRSTAT
ncbi:MAG: AzlC family ABC transporter permease [Proteobacteria bacterium]|nr:AzlC family ABC transporter permease [Pseudomonadota bacterium]